MKGARRFPPTKTAPQAGRPRRHKGDREPPKDKKLPHAANAGQPTKVTAQPRGDQNIAPRQPTRHDPKGRPCGPGSTRKYNRRTRNGPPETKNCSVWQRTVQPEVRSKKLCFHDGERSTANKGDRAAWR